MDRRSFMANKEVGGVYPVHYAYPDKGINERLLKGNTNDHNQNSNNCKGRCYARGIASDAQASSVPAHQHSNGGGCFARAALKGE